MLDVIIAWLIAIIIGIGLSAMIAERNERIRRRRRMIGR